MAKLITGLSHVGIRVHELARSRAFYELLGFEFVIGPVGPEPVAILKHPGGLEINLVLNGAASDAPNVLMDVDVKHAGYTHMALAVQDIDAARDLLEGAGFPITETVNFPGGARLIFVRDPDRNVVELNDVAFKGVELEQLGKG